MQAFCTLLSSMDYLNSVLILNESIKQSKSSYPLMVMVTKDLINENNLYETLRRKDIIVEIIPKLHYSIITRLKHQNKAVLNTASKMNILNMHQYDKLVYLDADMFLLKNCDELFNYKDGSMAWDGHEGVSTIFVIEPKKHSEFRFMKAAMEQEDCFDGDLLGSCWFFVKSNQENYVIPLKYCYGIEIKEKFFIPEETKIIHLSHDNPIWNYSPSYLNGFDYPLNYYQKLMPKGD